MKNNEYLEKYGEKALEIYKKSLKLSEEPHPPSPQKISLKKNSKGSRKNLVTSKSKSKIHINQEVVHSFNKPLLPEKGKKKLLISGLSTPKNKTFRAEANKEERNRSTSTKKKELSKRVCQKLNKALENSKSTKSMVKNAVECLDIIAQEENKLFKWINQFRQIMLKIVEELQDAKKKYKIATIKTRNLEKELTEMKEKHKINYDSLNRKSVEVVIMEENQTLRNTVRELKTKVSLFERKQMALIGAIEQLKVKSSDSQRETLVKDGVKEKNERTFKEEFYEDAMPGMNSEEESEDQN